MLDQRRAGLAVTGHQVEHAGRQAHMPGDLREQQCRERRELRGLQHDGAAGRQGRGDLPGEHQQREVPGDYLPGDASRPVTGELAVQQLRPARMVIEVPGGKRDVQVTRLADRFAVVQRVEYGEQPAVFLDLPRQGVQEAGPHVAGRGGPACLGSSGCLHGTVHISGTALAYPRQHFAGGGVDRVETGRGGRVGEAAADEVAESRSVGLQPFVGQAA